MKKIFTLIAAVAMAASVSAQTTYTLDINKIYGDASNATGSCPNATLSGGTKYLLNDATIEQDVFTVVSKADRTFRIDVIQTDEESNIKPVEYSADYTGSYRLEPNGASNKTGGRQIFLEAKGAGKLFVGAWGNAGRKLAVMEASDKTSYYAVSDADALYVHAFSADETKATANDAAQVFEIEIPSKGIYCITQDAGIYFGYISFTQTGADEVDTPSDPTPATVWDFTTLSDADAANLAADADNWTFSEEKGYWYNTTVLAEKSVFTLLKANGAELDITKGIEFARAAGDGIEAERVRISPDKSVAVNGGNVILRLGKLAKDDVIKIRLKGAGESERELTVANTEITDGTLTTADTDVHEAVLKVLADGVVTMTTSNGFQFMGLAINAELPEAPGESDAIATVVAEQLAQPTYNLAGQQVGAGFRGIAIENGKKVVRK